jgi:hypothetical protein
MARNLVYLDEKLVNPEETCAGAAAVAVTVVAGTLAYFVARFLAGMQLERAALHTPQKGPSAASSVAMHTTQEVTSQEDTGLQAVDAAHGMDEDDVSYWDVTPEEEHGGQQQQVRIGRAEVVLAVIPPLFMRRRHHPQELSWGR